ncbi:Uncharacterised protein [uncultured archaeon]|nr:Uncharacterised protein [uncultured archaeon]
MQALLSKREPKEAVYEGSKAKYLETRGNLSFSNWFNVKDEKTGESVMVPGRIQYVLESLDRKHEGWVSPREQYWFIIETPATPDHVIVNARKGRDTKGLPITVAKGVVVPNPVAPEWMAKAVKDEILPWLLPLAESRYKKPIVTRDDEHRLVFVDCAGFHTYWSKSGRKTSTINVEKGDRESAEGAHLQVQFDSFDYETWKREDRQILYFHYDGREGGMKLTLLTNRIQKAWERPALALSSRDAEYDPVAVTPGLEKAARKTLAELEKAFDRAERVKASVAFHDVCTRMVKGLKGTE